ncbi:hypothetical protein C8J56DRAFT_1048524 [Mycena floridula]|nr:hypothetical protein C8J56DRAFT_1048524 [Mycena floridula]
MRLSPYSRSYSLSGISNNNSSFSNHSSPHFPVPSPSPAPTQSPGRSRIVLSHHLTLLGPRCLPRADNGPAQESLEDSPSEDDGLESEEETRRAEPVPRAQGNGQSGLGRKHKKPSGGSRRKKRARIAVDDDEDSNYGTGTGTRNRNCTAKSKRQSSAAKVTQRRSRVRPDLASQGKQVASQGSVNEPQLPSLNTKYIILRLVEFSTDYRGLPLLKQLLRVETQRRIFAAKGQYQTLEEAQARIPDFAKEAEVTREKFNHWLQYGARLVYICGAASPYILLVMASVGFKQYLASNVRRDVIDAVGLEISSLVDPCRKIIVTQLLPLLEDLRYYIGSQYNNVFFRLSFGGQAVPFHDTGHITGLLRGIDLLWLELPLPYQEWHTFFNRNIQDAYTPKFLSNILPPLVPISIQQSETLTLQIPGYLLGQQKVKVSKSWSEMQRKLVMEGKVAKSYDDLIDYLRSSFSEGVRINNEAYIRFDTAILEKRKLHILDSQGSTAVYLLPGLNEELPQLNDFITNKIPLLQPDFRYMTPEEQNGRFPAYHAINFGRYSEKGHSAPDDVHPSFYKTIGSKVHLTQRVPYEAKMVHEDPAGAEAYDVAFQHVQRIVEYATRTGLVKHHDKLDIIAQSLPLNDGSAAYLYAGYIVNINAKTDGHLDPNDRDICAIVGYGHYIDGDIVLYQLGTAFKLHALDFFFFDSKRITHLNLRFTGK